MLVVHEVHEEHVDGVADAVAKSVIFVGANEPEGGVVKPFISCHEILVLGVLEQELRETVVAIAIGRIIWNASTSDEVSGDGVVLWEKVVLDGIIVLSANKVIETLLSVEAGAVESGRVVVDFELNAKS